MNILLDTNVLVAAFISHGTCAELLEHCALNHTLFSSVPLLDEFKETLVSKFAFTPPEARNAAALLKSKVCLVELESGVSGICRDPNDDVVPATARAGACRLVVTGDKDRLDLKVYRRIKIVSPNNFWKQEDIDTSGIKT